VWVHPALIGLRPLSTCSAWSCCWPGSPNAA